MFKFEKAQEAERMLNYGTRMLGKTMLGLKKWNPSFGCIRPKESNKEVWVRVLGLALHIRGRKMLVAMRRAAVSSLLKWWLVVENVRVMLQHAHKGHGCMKDVQ